MRKTNLSPLTLLELKSLFNEKNWSIDEESNLKTSLFKRFSDRLKYLDDKEQNLFIELSRSFKQIPMDEYQDKILSSFYLIEEKRLKSIDKIIFTPLLKPYIENQSSDKIERGKTKSAQFIYYMLEADDLRWNDYSEKFIFCERISDVKKEYIKNNCIILFVDDYVGSGKTAVKCGEIFLKEIGNSKEVDIQDFAVLTIASQELGVKYVLDKTGMKTYSDIIRKRGISDYFKKQEDIKDHIKTMIQMEKKLYCPKDHSLGYEKTEGLITFMKKTPNNTFPVYWHETETKIAPFPRYKNYK